MGAKDVVSIKPPEGMVLKRKRFCEEYLIDGNATQAAIRAGYAPASAAATGSRLLTFADIQEHIAALDEGRSQRVGFTADEVLRELAGIVRADPTHYVITETGDIDLAPDVPESAWRAVASVKKKVRLIPVKDSEPIRQVEAEIRLWDKNAAIDKAMKHLGMLEGSGTAVRVEVVLRREA